METNKLVIGNNNMVISRNELDNLRAIVYKNMFGDTKIENITDEDLIKYNNRVKCRIEQIKLCKEMFPKKSIDQLTDEELNKISEVLKNKPLKEKGENMLKDFNIEQIRSYLEHYKLKLEDEPDSRSTKGRVNIKSYSKNVEVKTTGDKKIIVDSNDIRKSISEKHADNNSVDIIGLSNNKEMVEDD